MKNAISEIMNDAEKIVKLTASSPFDKNEEFSKTVLRPVKLKNVDGFQAERYKNSQVFHLNFSRDELKNRLENLFAKYRQICVFFEGVTATYSVNTALRARKTTVKNNLKKGGATGNDREKRYLLNEGDEIPALVDLGVFTPDFRIIKSKYDKFKQINRFLEIIDDELKNYSEDSITVLVFGCGKSYLTFIVRHYLVNLRKIKAKIIGYDLKKDVVDDCNLIVEKYGYDDISFVVADVKKDVLYDEKIDLIISLHACDTATDYAINYAVQKNVKYLFSVPCCQHEINMTIKTGGDLDSLLKYGIIKERVSALLTDTVRALLLDDCGYSVDVLEFVDLAHSPKNIMIRAVKTKAPSEKNRPAVKSLMEKYGFTQTLFSLTEKRGD